MEYKIGLCQMKGSGSENVDINKKETWAKAEGMVRKAAAEGCVMVSLPEMWNTPYANEYFRPYGEEETGETVRKMSELAKELGIYLIGGTISEIEEDRVYNTSYVFDKKGKIIGKHRKVHLFDINIEGGIRFMESDTLTAGDSITVCDTEYGRIGIAICFDVRFPELFLRMAEEGAELIFLPAAFNTTTGPMHWELLMKARAIDSQCYIAAVSPARNMEASYHAYGGTCLVDPWGKVVAMADETEQIVYAAFNQEKVKEVRRQIPVLSGRRKDVYSKGI